VRKPIFNWLAQAISEKNNIRYDIPSRRVGIPLGAVVMGDRW
jgi:hypothetical protein